MSEPTQAPLFVSQPQNITTRSKHHSSGSYTPVIMVLFVIAILSVASCILGRRYLKRSNDHVLQDLEKGLGMAKAYATKSKNKEAASSKTKSEMTTGTAKCELHGSKINHKKLFGTKTTASIMSKKQALNRCELHGVYLSRHNINNTSDLSSTYDEVQANFNLN